MYKPCSLSVDHVHMINLYTKQHNAAPQQLTTFYGLIPIDLATTCIL